MLLLSLFGVRALCRALAGTRHGRDFWRACGQLHGYFLDDPAAGQEVLWRPVPSGSVHCACGSGPRAAEWLALVLDGASVAGQRLLTIDYSRYAEAEAALGWLNWRAEYRPKTPLSPLALVGPIFDELDRLLTNAAIDIAHLKAFDRTPTGYIKASICHNGEDPVVEGDRLAAPTRHHDLTINLRALGAPEVLRDAMESAITVLPGKAINVRVRAFRPEAPSPEHRFDQIL